MLAVSAIACVPQADGLRPDSDLVVISVIGTNDMHGQFGPAPGRGGITSVSGYVAAVRAARARDGGVVLVDGGDMWQGTLASNLNEGALMVAAFNALDYDAAVIGNHEFDFGPVGPDSLPVSPADDPKGNLKRRAAEAEFPLLAANLIDEETGEMVAWENVRASVLVDVAGVRVGIVGVLTQSTLLTTLSANVGGLRIAPLAETIVREASRLRAAGAVLVVVAAHAGGRCFDYTDPRDLSSCDLSSEILSVARELPSGLVDHIVGGHEAHAIAHFVNGTAITVGRAYGEAFGRVDFWVDRDSGAVRGALLHRPRSACLFQDSAGNCVWIQDAATAAMPVTYEGHAAVPVPDIVTIASRAADRAAAVENESLGVMLKAPFTLDGNPESTLGKLVTDALLDSLDVDIAMLNVRGGLRSGLPQGDLVYGSLFRMFPFDNRIAILELSGAELRSIIAAQALEHRPRLGFAGMQVTVSCEHDSIDVVMKRASGSVIAAGDHLRVAVNDYLATGGDRILSPAMPADGFEFASDPRLVRNVIATWFRRRGGVLDPAQYAGIEKRWTLPETMDGGCEP